ncbi:hypothetical protein CS022_08115 [Veronia nyctiphanis]|uniref:Uncharacterized protein n=1 Tax=Veronia nyctiphanis TaxID=1278244 RepID=A0A4Q0YSM7_9GAMM|nr:hypothetical protein [Veronia nyctiphanis]RXJ73695.1 hypothetical protein CS022_08115 [Veronia nyctiphanis]
MNKKEADQVTGGMDPFTIAIGIIGIAGAGLSAAAAGIGLITAGIGLAVTIWDLIGNKRK